MVAIMAVTALILTDASPSSPSVNYLLAEKGTFASASRKESFYQSILSEALLPDEFPWLTYVSVPARGIEQSFYIEDPEKASSGAEWSECVVHSIRTHEGFRSRYYAWLRAKSNVRPPSDDGYVGPRPEIEHRTSRFPAPMCRRLRRLWATAIDTARNKPRSDNPTLLLNGPAQVAHFATSSLGAGFRSGYIDVPTPSPKLESLLGCAQTVLQVVMTAPPAGAVQFEPLVAAVSHAEKLFAIDGGTEDPKY